MAVSCLIWTAVVRDLPVRFVIVGGGGRRDWLAAEIKRLVLTNVTLIEYQPKERMAEINAGCDLPLVPLTISGVKEGFPRRCIPTWHARERTSSPLKRGSEMAALVLSAKCGRTAPPENAPAQRAPPTL